MESRAAIPNGALVFWHSPRGLTFWINAYDAGEPDDALAEWQEIHAAAAFDLIEEREADFIRFAYRLDEDAEDGRQPAFYGFACARDGGQIHIAGYFDDPSLLDAVLATWRSLRFGPPLQ